MALWDFANFQNGPHIEFRVQKCYAWYPIRTKSRKTLFMTEYYVVKKFVDYEQESSKILTKNEYLIWALEHDDERIRRGR